MKFLTSQISLFMQQRGMRRNIGFLMRFIFMLLTLIAIYSIVFHYIMEYEQRSYSWVTGVYWTLTVMSTLGFGDITFTSDLGRIFSIVVLLSGVLLLLIMLPFTFIQFFYAPWLEVQKKGHTPRSLPPEVKGHIIVVSPDPIALNLVDDLKNYGARCVILSHDSQTTLDLLDQGYEAVAGEHDSGDVYRKLRLSAAAMMVVLDSDVRNTNIVFTARDVDRHVPIVAGVQSDDAIDILQLAGCSHVFRFHKLLGEALARRVLNGDAQATVISRFKELAVAEAPVMRTRLVGKSLSESGLRQLTGANVVGLQERGKFVLPTATTRFTSTMVMVIAGTEEQIESVNRLLASGRTHQVANEDAPVLILGCGRVGLAAARQLEAGGRQYCIVDKSMKRHIAPDHIVVGDAADIEVLEKAGIRTAPSVIITTHDDDTNIYLTLYCRRLREDIQIISRATLDRNVGILHAAGADLVLSLASMVTSSIINLLAPGKVTMINEGLNIFRSTVGKRLDGRELMSSGIRSKTHCSVVALRDAQGDLHINPDPRHVFARGEELYLIGDSGAERAFYETFGQDDALTEGE
ncbi:NAD-binding protein [Desulfovibrio piger]|nr:NAD-binding protein [Desulfovibrio piger]